MEAIRAAAGKDAERWLDDLPAKTGSRDCPPPTIWNTVHLVVTGTTATHALLIALHHPSGYKEKTLERLRMETGRKSRELEHAFSEATGETMTQGARSWLRSRREPESSATGVKVRYTEARDNGKTILTDLAEETRADPDEPSTLRIMMRGIARTWKGLDERERRRTLAIAPCLSRTKWDALLAAVTEHVAWLTGQPRPRWVDDTARFNEPPQSYSEIEKGNAVF